MTFPIAEVFTSPQGEGRWTGQVMTFVRFVGCSVGKTICHHCDTDFNDMYPWKGGGEIESLEDIPELAPHICFTGGEPLNRDLHLLMEPACCSHRFSIETSGTTLPSWLQASRRPLDSQLRDYGDFSAWTWICVSPKPGYLDAMITLADEVKVLVPGLGNGPGWPTINDALRWADEGKLVYLQPCNKKNEPDMVNLQLVLEIINKHPQLKLSAQLHKFIKVR